ncbi:MAG: O-antigen/teichoic acid export membrane protein [Myxococcota bacterium]
MSGLRRSTLRVNFSWMLVGYLVYAASQWGVVVTLTKLGSPAMLGTFALALALTAPVFQFANLNLRAVQATDTEGEHTFSDYFGQRLIATPIGLAVIGLAMLVADYPTATILVTLTVALAKAVESISDIFYGLYQRRERMDGIARSLMLRGPLNVAVIAVILWSTGSLVAAVVGQLGVWTTILLVHDVPRARVVLGGDPMRPRFQWPRLRQLTWTALPLGMVVLLISLTANAPRYIIEHFSGEWELGIFAAMAWLVQAGQTVIRALGQAAIPRLAAHYASGRRMRFVQLAAVLQGFAVLVGGAGVAVAAWGGPMILEVMYTAEYAAHSDVLVVIMLAGGLTYMTWFFMNIITAARYFQPQVPIAVTTLAVTVVGCMYLVPTYGILGAAWAWVIAQLVQLAWGIVLTGFAVVAKPVARPDEPSAESLPA